MEGHQVKEALWVGDLDTIRRAIESERFDNYGRDMTRALLQAWEKGDEIRQAARRVYLKFGASTDYTEWRTLASALGIDWRIEESRAIREAGPTNAREAVKAIFPFARATKGTDDVWIVVRGGPGGANVAFTHLGEGDLDVEKAWENAAVRVAELSKEKIEALIKAYDNVGEALHEAVMREDDDE